MHHGGQEQGLPCVPSSSRTSIACNRFLPKGYPNRFKRSKRSFSAAIALGPIHASGPKFGQRVSTQRTSNGPQSVNPVVLMCSPEDSHG